MYSASVQFHLKESPASNTREEIARAAGRQLRNVGEDFYVQFQGDHMMDMPDNYIPGSFLDWVELNQELLAGVTLKARHYARAPEKNLGLYTIGRAELSVTNFYGRGHDILVRGPVFEEMVQAFRELVTWDKKPGRYDLEGNEFELEKELRRLQVRNGELEVELASLRRSSSGYRPQKLATTSPSVGNEKSWDRRDCWPGE